MGIDEEANKLPRAREPASGWSEQAKAGGTWREGRAAAAAADAWSQGEVVVRLSTEEKRERTQRGLESGLKNGV